MGENTHTWIGRSLGDDQPIGRGSWQLFSRIVVRDRLQQRLRATNLPGKRGAALREAAEGARKREEEEHHRNPQRLRLLQEETGKEKDGVEAQRKVEG